MTQLEYSRKKTITSQMKYVAEQENIKPEFLRSKIEKGEVVIPFNINHNPSKPCGIGRGLKTKVNANIGISEGCENIHQELLKLKICVDLGADTIMELSVGKETARLRQEILSNSLIPVGNVPIYETACRTLANNKEIPDIKPKEIIDIFEYQAQQGIDFATIHCGINLKTSKVLQNSNRVIEIVSRGGAILLEWIKKNNRENPYYENFNSILNISKKYDVTLSLGDALRPGAIADATDKPQIEELKELGRLAKIARKSGVQVIIEGPGHIPLNEIEKNIKLQKKLCGNIPFYVLGPIVTDVALGYDHISAAIGGALAAYYGADFLCYVTPSEHLRLPTVEDVREGLISARIAAHVADIAKGLKGAKEWDNSISNARSLRDWESQIEKSLYPQKARDYRGVLKSKLEDVCSMCESLCAIKKGKKALNR